MTRTNPQSTSSPHLRPDDADLGRLLAGEHHDPHSVLGAHEYGDHTVIRVLRPHALEVVALIGGERYPFSHVRTRLFAVAVPFTNLVDYRLEVAYPGGDVARRDTRSPTRTASCPRSARSTCTCSPRAATNGCGRCLARTRAPSRHARRPGRRASPSRCGRRTPRASA